MTKQRLHKGGKSAFQFEPRLETLEDRWTPTANVGVNSLAYQDWRQTQFSIDPFQASSVSAAPMSNFIVAALPTPTVTANPTPTPSNQLIGLDTVARNYAYTGYGYSVAVIDTGIDYNHPNLGGGWGYRVIAGYDFVDHDNDPMDLNGHGTHVAGIIGSNNATYRGVAPDVNLIALRVLDANGVGDYGSVEDALRWVATYRYQYNIVAVNISLGSGNYTYNPYTFLDDEFATLKNQGVFVAVASGNDYFVDGSQTGVSFPAISSSVVSVGAVWSANNGSAAWADGARDYTTAADRITSFTQRGPMLDILAPGAMVTSTYPGGRFAESSGTSMATPYVTATAALLHQVMDYTGQSWLATSDGILNMMQQTGATVWDGDDENDNVGNTGLSFKRIDVAAAIRAILPKTASLPYSDSFARTDSTKIGSPWTTQTGSASIISQHVLTTSTAPVVSYLNGIYTSDVSLSAEVNVGTYGLRAFGLIARYSGPGDNNLYVGQLVQSNGVTFAQIGKNVGGVWSALSTMAVGTGSGRLRFDTVGSMLSLYFDDVLVCTATDVSLSGGGIGIRGSGLYSVLDNFAASTIAPFSETTPINASNVISGTSAADSIVVKRFGVSTTDVMVTLNGTSLGRFRPTTTKPLQIFAGGGNDYVVVDGSVTIPVYSEGGSGNDTLMGGSGADTFYGGLGNDLLFGGIGDDLLFGEAGDDAVDGNDGNDTIDGGDGIDRLYGSLGDDLIFGSAGADTLDGGAGNDRLDGGDGNDLLFGQAGNDLMFGQGGNDSMDGGDGDDAMDGGAGNDVLYGMAGTDQLYGSAGDDTMDGGLGYDSFSDPVGLNVIYNMG